MHEIKINKVLWQNNNNDKQLPRLIKKKGCKHCQNQEYSEKENITTESIDIKR